jgi:hypothetical protein
MGQRLIISESEKNRIKSLYEQSDPLEGWDKLKEGQKIVLKSDIDGKITSWIVDATSPNPGRGGSGTKLFLYPDGEESRKITNGSIEVSFFPKDMKVDMFNGMNSIVKDSVNSLKKPVVKSQPTQQPIKPGGVEPTQFINIVNMLTNKLVMKLNPKYNLRWSEGTEGGTPQLLGKTDKGENVVLDFECGMHEGNVVFTVIRYDNGKMITGDFMSINKNINSGEFCGVG